MILHRDRRLKVSLSNGFLFFGHLFTLRFPLRRLLPIHLALRHPSPTLQPNPQPIHPLLQLPHLPNLHLLPIQNLPLPFPPPLHPLDPLKPQHLRLPDPFSQYDLILTPPPLDPAYQRLLHIDPNDNRARVPHAGDNLIGQLRLRPAQGLKIRIDRRHLRRHPGREMDVLPPHGPEPAAPLDLLPRLVVRPVHDVGRTVGVGQQDGFEDLLRQDRRKGVTLAGADAPVGGVGVGGAAGSGGGGAEGAAGVRGDLVALFVVGGDDGLEFREVDV